jgi:hypothetical protein
MDNPYCLLWAWLESTAESSDNPGFCFVFCVKNMNAAGVIKLSYLQLYFSG